MVGFAYSDETCRGFGIIAVVVRVVFLGEGIELALDFRGRSRRGQMQRLIVVDQRIGGSWCCGMQVCDLNAPRRSRYCATETCVTDVLR